MRCCCFEVVWPSGEGLHLETTRRELEPPPSSIILPATTFCNLYMIIPRNFRRNDTQKKKKWGLRNFTRNLNPPPSPMWVLRPPSSRHGRYEQLANRLRNSCFSASSFSRTAASAFQEAAVSNSFPLLSFPFPPHMLSWPCAALKYTCSQYFW